MKYLKFDRYDLCAGILIMCATALRIIFDALGWPPTNADEGTMGIMALHIAYRGEHPYIFYGQSYMGVIEAYLGAFFFHLFGPSLFALRLGVILLTMLFLISTYLLTRLLYSKPFGLFILALLSFGSIYVFTREMIATGGTTQTLFFGSLSLLLACWLGMTAGRNSSRLTVFLRALVYTCWGLAIGLGVWSDMIVLPIFAMAIVLLVLFCWRDLLVWAWLPILTGFLVGAAPLIQYNLQAYKGNDSISILFDLFQGSTTQAPHTLQGILLGIKNTVLISMPIATGNPFCPVIELPWLGDNSPHTPICTVAHAFWGFGFLALLALSLITCVVGLWWLRRRRPDGLDRATLVRSITHLCMLGAGLLALAVFAVSSAPISWPGFHARYLSTLLIIIPAVLFPLWQGATAFTSRFSTLNRWIPLFSRGALALIFLFYLIGTGILISEIPRTQVQNQRMADLRQTLERLGATRIYTDYWSCDNTAFLSDERIVCAVMETNLQMELMHNRYPPYEEAVIHDPHAAYVFPDTSQQLVTLEHKIAHSETHYRILKQDGYTIFLPQQ